MPYVYIIQDTISKRYYIGSCLELAKRIKRHKQHTGGKTTHSGDWNLVYYKHCDNMKVARELEKLIKSYKGGNAFKRIVSGDLEETERWLSWSKAPHC